MNDVISKQDFTFTIKSYGMYEVIYTSPKTNKEWKFDIADFISTGEAIDLNTFDVNPTSNYYENM